jgi:hypothetical protein
MELAKETLEFIDKKARDQDVMYFFTALGANFKTRRLLTQHFQNNYETVCVFPAVVAYRDLLIGDSSTNGSRATFRSTI